MANLSDHLNSIVFTYLLLKLTIFQPFKRLIIYIRTHFIRETVAPNLYDHRHRFVCKFKSHNRIITLFRLTVHNCRFPTRITIQLWILLIPCELRQPLQSADLLPFVSPNQISYSIRYYRIIFCI